MEIYKLSLQRDVFDFIGEALLCKLRMKLKFLL